jgi:exopolysaccharide biosynthesis polyprenyl glycosylphosphotransferase
VSATAATLYQQVDEQTREILLRRRTKVQRRGWLVRRALLAADLFGLAGAFLVAQLLFAHRGPGVDRVAEFYEYGIFLVTLPAWIVVAKLYGLYERDEERTDHSTVEDMVDVFHLLTVGVWLLFGFTRLTDVASPTVPKLFTFWVLGIVLVAGCRVLARTYCRRQLIYLQNTLIVGAGDVGQLVARKLLQHHEYGINLVGFVDDNPRERREDLSSFAILGVPDDLAEICQVLDVERVIFAFSNETPHRELDLVRSLDHLDVQIDMVPRLFEIVTPTANLHTVEGLPVLSLSPVRLSRSSRALKRALDVLVSAVALTILAPLFAFVAWRIRRGSPGPVFFRQTRLGMDMKEFTVLKFRTMTDGTSSAPHEEYIRQSAAGVVAHESNGLFKLDRSDCVTKTGRWLRRTSLDELPQLINVLRGEMSLVGPRPCLAYEIESFERHHFERFAVPAGMTGMWQVLARAHSTFREALDMDVAYVRGWSLGLDLQLLCRTPLQLLRPKGTR